MKHQICRTLTPRLEERFVLAIKQSACIFIFLHLKLHFRTRYELEYALKDSWHDFDQVNVMNGQMKTCKGYAMYVKLEIEFPIFL